MTTSTTFAGGAPLDQSAPPATHSRWRRPLTQWLLDRQADEVTELLTAALARLDQRGRPPRCPRCGRLLPRDRS